MLERIQPGYREDFALWVGAQVEALRAGRFEDLDIANMIEELESLGKSERRAIHSQLRRLWLHVLKCRYQPKKRTKSWDDSIDDALEEIFVILRDSPSLRREFVLTAVDAYRFARRKTARETRLRLSIFPQFGTDFSLIAHAIVNAKTIDDLDALEALIRKTIDA